MAQPPTPTEREMEILKILWQRGEATVREVHTEMSRRLPIVQNTVQAFLRTMEEKGLVRHRVEGRTFIYRPVPERDETHRRLAQRLLEGAFDGAIDQLVQSVFALRPPTTGELEELERLIEEARSRKKSSRQPKGTK